MALSTKLATASINKSRSPCTVRGLSTSTCKRDAPCFRRSAHRCRNLTQHFVERDVAETGGPAAVLDLRQAQQRRDDRQRLIDAGDRLVCNRLELLQRCRVGAATLERQAGARQRRPQIMRDIVTDAGQRMDHGFHFIEHAIDDDRELENGSSTVPMRQPLAQISGDDALNPLIDLLDPSLRAHAEPCAGQQTEAKCRQQAERERLPYDTGNFPGLIDISSDHQHVAACRIRRAIARTV